MSTKPLKSKAKKKTSYERRAKNKINLSCYIERDVKEILREKAEKNEMTMTDYLVHLIKVS